MRLLFLLPILFLSASAMATPPFLDIARGIDGQVLLMKKSEAARYCANLGARLPSVRELAQLSMSFGASGILDNCDTDTRCYQINAINADGVHDSFYFSYTGYQRPAGDLGNNWFWSSSISPEYPLYAFDLQGSFGIISGHIVGRDAVRCVY